MKTKILLVFIIALLISACAAPSTPQPTKPIATVDEADATSAGSMPPNEDLSAMATYADDIAGFLLDYPAGWFLETSVLVHAEEVDNYSISIFSWDMNNPPAMGSNGLPGNGTKFDVTVIKNATTLEAAVEQVRQSGTPILARKDFTLPNGVPAVILDYESFAGPGKMLISILNGNFIYVTGYGDLDPYETVAFSLRAK